MTSRLSHLECARCSKRLDAFVLQNRCDCGGTLVPRYDLAAPRPLEEVRARPSGPWRYEELLPLQGAPVSLGENETPLLFCERLSKRLGVATWIKDDSPLPGSTFKARGACVGLSRAIELGVERVNERPAQAAPTDAEVRLRDVLFFGHLSGLLQNLLVRPVVVFKHQLDVVSFQVLYSTRFVLSSEA